MGKSIWIIRTNIELVDDGTQKVALFGYFFVVINNTIVTTAAFTDINANNSIRILSKYIQRFIAVLFNLSHSHSLARSLAGTNFN